MPFEKIELELTEQQMDALKPFSDQIHVNKGTVIAEMFIMEKDAWRYRKAVVRLLDSAAVIPVSQALVSAEKEYDERQDRARRFKDLRDALVRSLPLVSLGDGVLTIEREGRKYELREVESRQ